MRLPVAVLTAFIVLPVSAQAGTVGVEGAQIVFRADAGERVRAGIVHDPDGYIAFNVANVRPAPGCEEREGQVRCPVMAVTVITGDQADQVRVFSSVPVTALLGGGDDRLNLRGTTLSIDAGPGDDTGPINGSAVTLSGGEGDDIFTIDGVDASGPSALDAGPGDDFVSVGWLGAGTTLSGGDGDDELHAPGGPNAVAIACGPGADRWHAGPRDVPGDGCAAHLAGVTTATISRAFQEGALTGPASGSVTLRRWLGRYERPRGRIARGVFTAQPGPLRVSLRRTVAGKRRLRERPRLPVHVTILTRTGSDTGEMTFRSRLG